MYMQKIVSNGKVLAVVFSIDEYFENTLVLTPPEWGLQTCLLKRPSGYSVNLHTHFRKRELGEACELLLVLKGRVRVCLYDGNRLVQCVELCSGQGIIMRCPHATEILEDSKILEVKEGPYPGPDKDKVWIRLDIVT